MNRKLAIKRLTASDLTFFSWHFRNQNAGNQKALNLNADVFVDQIYPALPELSVEYGGRIPIDLSLFGPGIKGLHNLQRKIVKGAAYKNWRLNGEFIYNPEDDQDRYNALAPDDLVLIEFSGAAVPNAVTLVMVAQMVPADATLHSVLNTFLGQRRMAALDQADLDNLLAQSGLPDTHPAYRLSLDADLEDVVLGAGGGNRRVFAHYTSRQVGKDELLRARTGADQTGRLGEELVNAHLVQRTVSGELESIEWVSDVNAVAPFDFRIVTAEGQEILIDVKATSGEFERSIHLSFNEILQVANGAQRYDIYRAFGVSAKGGQLRVAKDIKDFGKVVLDSLRGLPDGVTADGVSVLPSRLPFSDVQPLDATEGED